MNILSRAEEYFINDNTDWHCGARSYRTISIMVFLSALALVGLTACEQVAKETSKQNSNASPATSNTNSAVYPTYGVHNDPSVSPCLPPNCVYQRGPGEPADPIYPEYWVSGWNMYRVYQNYSQYPPPYDDAPPAALKEGTDYEKSWGKTYYDSTWTGAGGEGAMMEHYEDRCLPIFPISNKFTCSFISLGKIAYFVTYEKDRPQGMPPVCLFSGFNHPPRRNFIEHLPYSAGDSAQIGPGGQGYSFWISGSDGKPVQTGVKPDRTAQQDIMFGYGFAPKDGKVMPQSFYFSGYPLPPANAPFVSQNYVGFKVVKPDPAETWDQVKNLDPASLPPCQLFDPPVNSRLLEGTTKQAPTWSDIGRWKSGRR